MTGAAARPYTLYRRAQWKLRRLLLAPPLREAGAAPGGPLVVAGLFRTASGVGQSARACAMGLEKHGARPLCVDLSAEFGQVDCEAGTALAPMPQARSGTLILHVNAPETERALFHLDMWRGRRWRIIGVWAWELAAAPASWLGAAARLSELWAPSRFVAGAFRERIAIPVKVVPPMVAPPDAAPEPAKARAFFGFSPADIVCLAMGDGRSSFERKNLAGAIAAFRKGAGARSDAKLIVKTRNLGEFPDAERAIRAAAAGDGRIRIVDGSLSKAGRDGLLAAADIFLSVHRSEGFGLVLAEAMALGKAVIATGWSGNMDFMDTQSAALIPHSLVRVACPIYRDAPAGAVWGEPDIAAAAAALARLMAEPAFRREMGEAGRRAVAEKLDGRAYVEALGLS